MLVELVDLAPSLALFARGITGRDYEVKSTDEFTGKVPQTSNGPLHHARAVYLPPSYAAFTDPSHNRGAFRVMALHQLGYREFGTFSFDMAVAAQSLTGLFEHAERQFEPRASEL